MHNENYYSDKIKELQKKKKKAHNRYVNKLYNQVGHYFVQTESKKGINNHNYDQFTYMDKDTFNELKEVANTMIYENGSWNLHLHNANNFYNWFAKSFRDDKGKKPNPNNEKNNSSNDNPDNQSNKDSTNNSDDSNKDDDSSSQDSNIDELNFLNHYNNENY